MTNQILATLIREIVQGLGGQWDESGLLDRGCPRGAPAGSYEMHYWVINGQMPIIIIVLRLEQGDKVRAFPDQENRGLNHMQAKLAERVYDLADPSVVDRLIAFYSLNVGSANTQV